MNMQPTTDAASAAVPHSPSHHFQTAQQEFDAGKLGMWLFLITEVLFFGGLFVAYAVYRDNHPEVFTYAQQYLNKTLGALNTVVLICSSLTMAWAVRCAQLNQRRGLKWCLLLTLTFASLFLGVKAVEYSAKWDEGLLWAGSFALEHPQHARLLPVSLLVLSAPAALGLVLATLATGFFRLVSRPAMMGLSLAAIATCVAFLVGVGVGVGVSQLSSPGGSKVATAEQVVHQEASGDETPHLAGVFFSIYFTMTGIHAIHILAGIGVIFWLYWGSLQNRFGSTYFAPVDFVGLYWHLVDLVWIYLFPLLYLIQS